MAYPRFQLARGFKTARRTSGNPSHSLTTWGDLDTTLDLTVAAQVGDMIEATVSALQNNEAVVGYLDVVTVVANAPVNSFATQGAPSASSQGVMAWFSKSGDSTPNAGGALYTIQAGDLSSGQVTLRLRRRNSAAVVKTIWATADLPFQWWVKNLGPADPN